jgi:hypothetical protein
MNDWTGNNLVTLHPFSGSQEDFQELVELAKKDKHGVVFPTETVLKGGKKVGWFSVGACPLVWAWLSTEEVKVRDTISMINIVEGVQRRLGAPGIYFPCGKESPIYKSNLMERIGYVNSGSYDFFFKKF